ncbi:hypothetical protein ANCCEY_09401 [Ancylostoma ceylanicum]|uniref:CDR ABC transporter domain-containing protein n=1 Tax=Ancylostoma ceylanicum TaxID=53326 RepID=A0A0D6LV34_9BILA|nr:hypothetical protein ANCCEY_09401 [Ancylostoma ceylanicum]
MTIVFTIHQPSSQVFELFDRCAVKAAFSSRRSEHLFYFRIYMMAEGRVAFCGSQAEAIEFWTSIGRPLPRNFNPSDHFISSLADQDGPRRNTAAVIAALTGVIYLNDSYTQEKVANINGSLYQMVVNMAFMFQFAVVNVSSSPLVPIVKMQRLLQHFCSEIHTFFREYGSGLYSASSYFIAKNLAEVSATCFFINQASLPWFFYPFKYLSYFGYAFESLVVNEWSTVDSISGTSYLCISNSGCTRPGKCYVNGTDVITSLSFAPEHMWTNVIIIASMIVAIRSLAFIGLWTRAKLQR